MKSLILALVALWVAAVPAFAQEDPVVVELFTSQGCSSCPPADALLQQLAHRSDVIALALHVDYWDYIGWKDEFADPAYTDRQRAYATLAGRNSIYTPQMIINGQTDIVGARPMDVMDAIDTHKAIPARVALEMTRTGNSVDISAQALDTDLGAMVVQMLRYQPERVSRITRGENAGHTITYTNVTEDWTVLSDWDGRAPLLLKATVEGAAPVVVLIQSAGAGPILAAAEIK